MKLVDTQRSGRCAREGVGVRVPPSAPHLFFPHPGSCPTPVLHEFQNPGYLPPSLLSQAIEVDQLLLELSRINAIIEGKELCGDEARLTPRADSF